VESAATTVAGTVLSGSTLGRDSSGRITEKTENIGGITSHYAYTYDQLGRLLTVTRDGALLEEYAYDNNGNRISENNVLLGISRTLTHSIEDQTITAGGVTYQHDPDGRLLSRTEGTATTQYAYAGTGELLSVTLPDNRVISYINDALGRRIVKKIDNVVVEKYLWSGLTTLLAVYDGNDTLLQRFEYADDRVPLAMTAAGQRYHLHYDQIGSLRLVTDAFGAILKEIAHDGFGNILSDSNPALTLPLGFAGGLHDRDTGLIRFGHRDYLPELGKWTAKDPIGFAGGDANLYGYVGADPVSWVDPEGLAAMIINLGRPPVTSSYTNPHGPGQQTFQVQPMGTSVTTTHDPDTIIFNDGSVVKIPDGSIIVITDSSVINTYEPSDIEKISPLSQLIDSYMNLPVKFGPRYIHDPAKEFGGPVGRGCK